MPGPWYRRFTLLALAMTLPAGAQTPSRRQQMEERLHSAVTHFSGVVSLYAKNLETGESIGIRENDRVRTASTIKLPILVTVFDEVAKGRAQWSEEITLRESDKVAGSGVLREFADGDRFKLSDLAHLMIVVSDNTATNLILDRFTADRVNQEMEKLGFSKTRSMRKILGDGKILNPNPSGLSAAGKLEENKRYGIGSSTPFEMVRLLEMLDRGEVVSPTASREILEILKRQQYRDGIARRLGETPVASKTGALDHLRSDVSIVYSNKGKIAIAITCDEIPNVDYSEDNPGLLMIADLTGILLDGLGQN